VESDFRGIIDLIRMRALLWQSDGKGDTYETVAVPDDHLEAVREWRDRLIETISENDEPMMELYLEGTEPTEEQLVAAIRRATIAGTVNPVLCGSAFKNKGVQPMLDAIVDYLPSPIDIPAVQGHAVGDETEIIHRNPDPSEPFAGAGLQDHVGPAPGQADLHPGLLRHPGVRQFRAELHQGPQGADRQDLPDAREQARGAPVRDRWPDRRGDGPEGHHHRRHPDRPGQAGDPGVDDVPGPGHQRGHRAADQGRTRTSWASPSSGWPRRTRPSRSGPTRRPARRSSPAWANCTSKVLVERMRREFRVEANIGRPQVAYRETVRRKAEKVEYTHKKQTGGAGQYAKVVINLEPTGGDGGGYEFENKITGGRVPREYIPSVDTGCQEAAEFGVLAGYPMVDVRVTLTDGSYHEVDSSEMAFKIAGSMAFKKAAAIADPVLLEPVMAVEVRTPDEYMGDVIGDLNSRRGQIQAMEERSGVRVVKANVPLSEMFGYVGDLRSRTQGRADYSMQFDSYAEVPPSIARRSSPKHAASNDQQAGPQAHGRPRERLAPLGGGRSQRGETSGEGQVRADEAARQHRHHRAH
jgi:elongation factor G